MVIVLSDSEKNRSGSPYLFENPFIYVTESGDLFIKKTRYFDERKITSFDPVELEEQLDQYSKIFTGLEERVNKATSVWEESGPEKLQEVEKQLKSLRDEVLTSDAAGNLETLLDKLEESLSMLKEKAAASDDGPSGEESATDKIVPAPEPEKGGESGGEPETDASEPEKADETAAVPEEQTSGTEKGEESAAVSESAASAPESESMDEKEEPPAEEGAGKYYRELAEKAESLAELTDWPYVTMEFANLEKLWSEGPEPGDVEIRLFKERIQEALESFEQKKETHFREQERIREENLEKKNQFLNQLKKIIDEGAWTSTKEVGKIRSQWDQLKPLPAGKAEELQPEFNRLLKEFDDHKVDRIVKKKQKEEENLAGKLMLLDKMKEMQKGLDSENVDWETAEKNLEKLNRQWRKIGRVPSEKNQETWDQYHKIQDQYHQLRFKNDKKYHKRIESFLSKKKQLIKEAEALMDDPDLAAAARNVNKLHRRWKKIGNLPQKVENELWDQFKGATDAFNDKKSANLDQLRIQEEKNLAEKQRLIKVAEELNDSEEWDETHDKYQKLMDQWKQAGPVPKKMSGKTWKQFKKAMDKFYDRRREHFKQIKENRKGNLEEKQEVLEKLKALTKHEDPIKSVEEAKPLQEDFKKAGYVPIKFKNKMWKEYRETCDIIYERFRAAKSAASIVGRENVADFSTNDIADIQKKQKEADRLRKEVNKLHNEMIQMKESLSYFKPSGKGSSLLDQVHEKLEKAEEKIERKEEHLEGIEKEIDQLRRSAG